MSNTEEPTTSLPYHSSIGGFLLAMAAILAGSGASFCWSFSLATFWYVCENGMAPTAEEQRSLWVTLMLQGVLAGALILGLGYAVIELVSDKFEKSDRQSHFEQNIMRSDLRKVQQNGDQVNTK